MSMVTPSPAPILPGLTVPAGLISPLSASDVTAFTMRTGMGHMHMLEALRTYVTTVVVPTVNANFDAFSADWDEQVTTLITAIDALLTTEQSNVNTALSTQTAAYQQAISDALNAIATADIPMTDPAIVAVLNAANTATKTWLDNHYGAGAVVTDVTVKAAYLALGSVLKTQLDADYAPKSILTDYANILAQSVAIAPLPLGNGQDDTAAILAVATPLHHLGATLLLQVGTYLVNLNFGPQFQQIRVIGQGMRATILKAYSKTLPVVQFNGGSGSIGGGGLEQLTLASADGANGANGDGIALAISGTTGTQHKRVRITGSFGVGIQFWNRVGQDFTEFNTFEGDIGGCYQVVLYKVDNGVESFHGSGLLVGTTINLPGDKTGPIVYMDKNALPYNAPMNFTVWFQSATAYLFGIGSQNRSSGRSPSFYGVITCEGHPDATGVAMGQTDNGFNAVILFAGHIMWLGVGTMVLGTLRMMENIFYEGGTVGGERKPWRSHAPLKNTPTVIAGGFLGSALNLVSVHIQAANYEKHILLLVQQSQFNDSGFITEIARTQNVDSGNKGDPTFTYVGYNLYAANPNFDSSFHAYVGVTPLHGSVNANFLPQAMYS